MPVEQELARIAPDRDMLLSIGVFDGVHLGHKKLLAELTRCAREQELQSGVITFKEHPEKSFHPETRISYLTDLAERVSLLKSAGVDRVIVLSFTRELAGMSAERFVSLLTRYLKMRGLIIGSDFALGRKREGTAEVLKELGEKMGFAVSVVPPAVISGEVVSSTAIRNALLQGDVEKVTRFTGRPFSLKRRVQSGAGRGGKMGFPTANLEIDPEQALPKDGVYATLAETGGKSYRSLTYIGERPTFNGGSRSVEVYIIDYKGDLYGKELKVSFIQHLRDDKKFASAQELEMQIAEDIKKGKAVLSAGQK
ncbi:MAG: bifunctional riboflavin kinase/FAD synthetase [Chloroflexota bacterium]